MATKTELLSALDGLRHAPEQWHYDAAGQCWTAQVDEYTLKVQRMSGWCEWSVTHERYGTLIEPTPVSVSTYAKVEALDYTRAHILGKMDEQQEAA